MAPNNIRGVTHQNDKKYLTNLIEDFVGMVNSLTAMVAYIRPLFYQASSLLNILSYF